MSYFLFGILLSLVLKSNAYDPFVGLLQQGEPCFETIDIEECNTTIPDVFTTKYKGTDTNIPDTQFWLFTSKSQEKAEPLHKCGGKLPENSSFDPTENTVIIITGIIESVCRYAWPREFKTQLFIRGGYNIILVDWTWGNLPDPAATAVNSFVVGEQTAFVIRNIMVQNNFTNGSKFHIIAHSGGVHAANTAGKFIREWSPSHKLRRITLLDPSIDRYENTDTARNTSYKEASFVDVYHTGGGTCFGPAIGLNFPSGHADFYPNGGYFQLSCYADILPNLLKGDVINAIGDLLLPPLCVHLQATQYFKATINHPGGLHVGVECDSYGDFLSGSCERCCKKDSSNCAVAGMDAERYFPHLGEPRKERKYYYNLGLVCPYNEDYDLINKDC